MKTAQMLFIAAAIYGAVGNSKSNYLVSGCLYFFSVISFILDV